MKSKIYIIILIISKRTHDFMLSSSSVASNICPSWAFALIFFFGKFIGILAVFIAQDSSVIYFFVETNFANFLTSVLKFFLNIKPSIATAFGTVIIAIFVLK